MKKKSLTLIVASLMLFGSVGCSTPDNGKTKIVFACNSGYVLEFEERIEEFNKIYPDIEVEVKGYTASSQGEFFQLIGSDIVGGVTPDVADIASEGMYAFAEAGLLEPIDDWLLRDEEELAETLAQMDTNLYNAHKIGGHMYSLPTVWNNMCIYYNKNVLAKAGLSEPQAGWTTEDFLAMCKTVAKNNNGGNNDVYGYAFYNSYFCTLEPWMRAFDTSLLNEDWSAANVSGNNAKTALQYLYDLVHTHKVSPSMGSSDIELFVQNKLAFMGCGIWYVQSLRNMGFSSEDYDVIPFPSDTGELRSVIGVGGAPVFKASKNKEAAWKLSKFLSSKSFQEEVLTNSIWAIPSVKSAADTLSTKANMPSNASIFYESATYAKNIPAPAQYMSVESSFLRNFGAYMAGAKTLDEAAAIMTDEVNEALQD